MHPSCKNPVPKQALIQFSQLTDPKAMVAWNKQHTPWLFEMGAHVQLSLQDYYQSLQNNPVEIEYQNLEIEPQQE